MLIVFFNIFQIIGIFYRIKPATSLKSRAYDSSEFMHNLRITADILLLFTYENTGSVNPKNPSLCPDMPGR